MKIIQGEVKITCKCGTVNDLYVTQKQQVPYGERVQMVNKTAEFANGKLK